MLGWRPGQARRHVDPPRDPDEVLVGRCQTCGERVEVKRGDVPPTVGREWNDVLSMECKGLLQIFGSKTYPTGWKPCGCRVLLTVKAKEVDGGQSQ
jgi:hypothetical protein